VFEITPAQETDDDVLGRLPVAPSVAFNSFSSGADGQSECLDGTRADILRKIDEWAASTTLPCVFWLCGMAGRGKTTIARTIARTYSGIGQLGASFFFSDSSGNTNEPSRLFTTIAFQLAASTSCQGLKGRIVNAVRTHPQVAEEVLSDQWRKLIVDPLKSHQSGLTGPPVVLVVLDALDECVGHHSDILACLSQAQEITTVRLCILVTSRPEKRIADVFNFLYPLSLYPWADLQPPRPPPNRQPNQQTNPQPNQQQPNQQQLNQQQLNQQQLNQQQLNQQQLNQQQLNQQQLNQQQLNQQQPNQQQPNQQQPNQQQPNQQQPNQQQPNQQSVPQPITTNRLSLDDVPLEQVGKDIASFYTAQLNSLALRERTADNGPDPGWQATPDIIDALVRKAAGLFIYGVKDLAPGLVSRCIPPDLQYACINWAQHLFESRLNFVPDVRKLLEDFLPRLFLPWLEAMSLIGKYPDAITALTRVSEWLLVSGLLLVLI